jgi:zinc protease
MQQPRFGAWAGVAALVAIGALGALGSLTALPALEAPPGAPSPAASSPPSTPQPPPVEDVRQLRFPPAPHFEIPRPERVALDNGLVVMLLEDHELPLVTLNAYLRTGSRLDPPAKLGLGALGGELLRTGGIAQGVDPRLGKDGALAGDALDEILDSHAANLEVTVGESSGRATLNCLKEDFPVLLPLFAAMLRHPAFDAAKLALAKDLAKNRLERENDDPDAVLWRELARLVYGADSPYGRTPTFATVDAIDRADLAAWHQRNLQPQLLVLGLSGDFRTAGALAAVRAAFADWPRGEARPAPGDSFPYRRQPNPGLFVVDKSDMSQSKVAMGHLGVVKSDPDFFALVVLDDVLSGSFASRLVKEIRTAKGLAYDVDGRVGSDWDHPGLTAFSLSTRAAATAAGISALVAEARDLLGARPPTDEEVGRAKQSILGSFVFHSDSPAKVLNQQLLFELYGYPADWLVRYRAGVEAVTTAAVRAAAARHVHPDHLTILVVGPGETADRSLAPFGKLIALPLPDVTGGRRN